MNWRTDIDENTDWIGHVRPARQGDKGPMVVHAVPLEAHMAELRLPIRLTKADSDRLCAVIKALAFVETK